MTSLGTLKRRLLSFGLLALGTVACSSCRDGVTPRAQDPLLPQHPAIARPAQLPTELGARAMAHVRTLVGFGARHPGSPGWQRQLDYLAGQFEMMGLQPRRDRFTDPREGIAFENVIVRIPGGTRDFVVVGAHHDTKVTHGHEDEDHNFPFVGANDGASGVGLLLALAEHWTRTPPPVSLELVCFDGEESIPFKWNLDRALFGSRRHVHSYREALAKDAGSPRILAMVLLDMVAAADLQIDDDTNSDPVLKSIFRAAAAACGHEQKFFANRLAVTDDHLPYRDAGIPVIDLIDLADNPQWHTKDDTLDHLSPTSLQIVGEVVLVALPAIARRYVSPDDGRRNGAAGR